MNLTVDIGNTSIKVAIFNSNELVLVKKNVTRQEVMGLIKTHRVSKCIISKVGKSSFDDLGIETLVLTHNTKLPIGLNYKTADTLGVDRIATICAASDLYPNTAALVIDIGSCITFDYLSEEKEFIGGVISPGPKLRAQAMHNFTASLPLVSEIEATDLVGKTTEECMKSGIYNGVLFEIKGFIDSFLEKSPEGKILLTGGYAKTFESSIKQSIFADSNLVLKGLNRILRFNNEK